MVSMKNIDFGNVDYGYVRPKARTPQVSQGLDFGAGIQPYDIPEEAKRYSDLDLGDLGDFGGYTGEDVSGNINLPTGWGQATDFWNKILSGQAGGVSTPGAWQTGLSRLGSLSETGEPVDIKGWWEAQKPIYAQSAEDQAKQLAEEAGLGGMRWSTPLQRNITEQVGRGQTELYGKAMEANLAAQEAAKNRVLQSLGLLYQYGTGQAGLGENAMARQMQAAGSLFGAGSAENQLYMDLANQMAGLGTGQFGMEQTQYGDIYNPAWMQTATGLLGQAGGGYPQTYQPSFWEQIAGVIPDIIGMLQKKQPTAGTTGGGWV